MQPQQPSYGAPQPPVAQPNYDFIVNPQPALRKIPLAGGSMLSRILVVGVGLIVLIIAFSIIKGLVSGGGNSAALLHVAQDQQAILHLTTAAAQQQGISGTNLNFAVTSNLVITSEKSQLLSYVTKQHQKISQKQLILKVKSSLDTQLTNAAAASTYDLTFQDIMKSQLADYQSALKFAYKQTTGVNGRKLLTADYNSAVLLTQQLSATN
jgi:hypothetical protein